MFLLLLICLCAAPSLGQQQPIVETVYGPVQGEAITLDDGSIVDVFMGIPFARPPVGVNRFELPEQVEPWTGVKNTTFPGRPCTQSGYSLASEDCLNLNVYSPQREDPDELIPVMAYFHGGDYYAGANFEYPGYFLARKGVVYVSINYRLAILGFGYTGDGVVSGNMGLMDMIQGLTFIQETIAAFGGDPNQVTIFGESAGGTSVGQLLMIPFSEGLFHGAIMQSGCEMEAWATMPPEMQPELLFREIGAQFGCPIDESQAMVNCLKTMDALDLWMADFTCPPGYESECASFRAVIDGTIIPDTYPNLRAQGEYMHVPEMNGLNENDGYFALYSFPGVDINAGIPRSDFNAYLIERAIYLSPKYANLTNPLDLAQAFNFFYADWPYYDDLESNREMVGRMYTDEWYGWPADLQVKLHSDDGNAAYFYVYDYLPEIYEDSTPEWIGVNHGVEIDAVFGWPYLLMAGNEQAYAHSQTSFTGDYTENDIAYSDFMMTLWTNFAIYGNPTPTPVSGPNNTEVTWPAFTSSELNYLNMKTTPEAKVDYRQKEYAFWREYLRYILYGNNFEAMGTKPRPTFSKGSSKRKPAERKPWKQ